MRKQGLIVSLTSGVRGGVGKSVVGVLLTYSLNYLGHSTLLVDAGGGSTRYVIDAPEPPYTRELSDTYNAILSVRFSFKKEKKRLFRKKVEEEKFIDFYLTPEVRHLKEEEIDKLLVVLPELKDYFDFIVLDLPAISADYYWKLPSASDLNIVVLTPEKTVYEQVFSTVKANWHVIIVNKFDSEIDEHRTALERIKHIARDVLALPYDPVLDLLALHGVGLLSYASPSKETTNALGDLVYHLSSIREAGEVRRVVRS